MGDCPETLPRRFMFFELSQLNCRLARDSISYVFGHVISELEFTGAVKLFLFFWVMHLRVQINLRHFQRFVAEPVLNFHEVEARAQPVGSRSFPKPVEILIGA